MAIQTYNDLYLHYVAENLGVMFEHAVNIGINPTIFWNTFINSNVAKQIEKGNPKYLTCSALDYLNEIYSGKREIPEKEDINRDRYYWAGWILAQYQHKKGCSFYKINNNLPIEQVLDLYSTLHEADVTKFFDVADTYFTKQEITILKKSDKQMDYLKANLPKKQVLNFAQFKCMNKDETTSTKPKAKPYTDLQSL